MGVPACVAVGVYGTINTIEQKPITTVYKLVFLIDTGKEKHGNVVLKKKIFT